MNRLNIVIVLCTLIVVGGIWFFMVSAGGTATDFVRAHHSSPSEFERDILDVPLEPVLFADTSLVFVPAQLVVHNDFVYMNDFSDFTIYELNENGNQLRKLETTRGDGPGEVRHLTGFDVKDDTIWIADSENLRVTSYSLETGKHIENYMLEHRPMRVAALENGFVVMWLGAEKLFSTFDHDGNEIASFGEIIEDQALHQLSLGGTLSSNGGDRFVYVPYYASLIYHFNSMGILINVMQAPDGIEFPVALRDGPTTFAPDFSYMRYSFLDDDDHLYVYTALPDEMDQPDPNRRPVSYIDKYSLRDAAYIRSLRMDEHYGAVIYHPDNQTVYTSDMEQSFIYRIGEEL